MTPPITPGIYVCVSCHSQGCSYCNGTGTVVYLSGRQDLDAAVNRWLVEHTERYWHPRVIMQGEYGGRR